MQKLIYTTEKNIELLKQYFDFKTEGEVTNIYRPLRNKIPILKRKVGLFKIRTEEYVQNWLMVNLQEERYFLLDEINFTINTKGGKHPTKEMYNETIKAEGIYLYKETTAEEGDCYSKIYFKFSSNLPF